MRILSDSIIEKYLISLNKNDILNYQAVMLAALKSYSLDPSLIPQRIVTKTSLATHLFMPALGKSVGFKALTGSVQGFTGATLILNPANGEVMGLLNAKNLTAFRTALASTIPLVKFFKNLKETNANNQLMVFGTGLQLYWHVRLTLKLYLGHIDKVVIANRSTANLEKLKERLLGEFPNIKFEVVLYENSDGCAVEADNSSIIYGCTPSTSPVIHYNWLKSKRRRYISLIGSYQPQMVEADSDFVNAVLTNVGKIVVDSVDHVAEEAGEIIQNSVPKEKLIQIADIDESLFEGNILLCKLVGLSIMDTSIGAEILSICDQKNIGLSVDEF